MKQYIICNTKPKSLHCFCSLTEKMYLFAKLIIVGVWFTGVLTLRLAVAFFIFPNTFFVRWVFQHLFMMTQNSVLLTFFSDVWASCFQVFSPHRNCSAVPVTSGFIYFFTTFILIFSCAQMLMVALAQFFIPFMVFLESHEKFYAF